MEIHDLKLLLQQHLTDGLVTIIGSGLSCAEGLPGMGELATHLDATVRTGLAAADIDRWNSISPLLPTKGLEAALLEAAPTPGLEIAIVARTAELIAMRERQIVAEVFSRTRTLRFTGLVKHLLKPHTGLPVVTTNYDRLVEVAVEEAGLGVDTLFVGHFSGELNEQESRLSFCREVTLKAERAQYRYRPRANIFKPHGSLDWYHRDGKPVRYSGDLDLPRLIITPGLNKFRNGYESPFDCHRERANSAIDRASRFLVIGYGFNDDHLETHLTPRIRGATEREYLIAMTERVTRSLREELPGPDDEDADGGLLAAVPTDLIQGVLIGTFRTVEGDRRNTFKRGADSFPQIDRDCFVIEGGNLQRFMGILGAGFSANERLKLGTFVADRTADAIASGDKFFQRHAAILGSTGSGKSWAVALILERAAKLKFPNIIVFDMHGEYAPLADKANGGFATRFRIAGPGDLENPADDTLFLPYWLLNHDEMLSMILDRSDQNAPNQASRFTLHVRSLKGHTLDAERKADIKKTYTVDSPIPYDVKQLVGLLNTDDTTKGIGAKGAPVKGEWEDKLTRFLSRLEAKLDDRRYGFMFAPPPAAMKYDWLAAQVLKLLQSGDDTGICAQYECGQVRARPLGKAA